VSPRPLVVVACAIGLGAVASLTAQIPRDTAVVTAGASSLAGVVVSDEETPRPLRQAVVTISGSALQPSRALVTDDAGRFAFTGLPATNLTLNVTKAGYISTAYGQKRPGKGPSIALSLAPGQKIDDVVVRLQKGAVITGTVRDEVGVARRNLQVVVQERRQINGQVQLVGRAGNVAVGSTTDDRGVYRAYGLPAGDYVVSAALPATSDQGPGMDLRRTTAQEVQWAAAQLRSGPVSDAGSPTTLQLPPSQALAAVPVFYPGTTDPGAASVITLRPGEERAGVDLAVAFVPATRVSGTVLSPEGLPVAGALVRRVAGNVAGGAIFVGGGTVATNAAGQFSIGGIPPGPVTLSVTTAPGRGVPTPALWAEAQLTASGIDATAVTLTLRPAMSVTGRVVFEGVSNAPMDMSRVRVTVVPAASPGPGVAMAAGVLVRPDGSFEVAGVVPGRYRLMSASPSAAGDLPWLVKSATINGRDAIDTPFDVTTASLTNAVITFTHQTSEISGRLFDAAGRPAPDYYVVAFSTDRDHWMEGSRRLRAPARPASDGTYRLAPLPAGSYYLAALTYIDQEDLYDREILEQIAAGALTITIGDGEKKVQDLRIGR
jgi:hypothetical protein